MDDKTFVLIIAAGKLDEKKSQPRFLRGNTGKNGGKEKRCLKYQFRLNKCSHLGAFIDADAFDGNLRPRIFIWLFLLLFFKNNSASTKRNREILAAVP